MPTTSAQRLPVPAAPDEAATCNGDCCALPTEVSVLAKNVCRVDNTAAIPFCNKIQIYACLDKKPNANVVAAIGGQHHGRVATGQTSLRHRYCKRIDDIVGRTYDLSGMSKLAFAAMSNEMASC